MADIVCPRRAGIRLAGERPLLRRSLGGPLAAERLGRERAEVPPLGADSLDDHEVLVLAADVVDLDGLEEVVGGVAHNNGGGGAEAAGELVDGHTGAVDLAVIAGEEEVHVLLVTDDGLVNAARAGAGDGAREEGLDAGPGVDVGRVVGGAVREGCRAPLVREDPGLLGGEVEEGGGYGGEGHLVLGGFSEVGPVLDDAEVHGAP